MANWNKWIDFEKTKLLELKPYLYDKAGVYSFRVVEKRSSKCLNRVCEKDKKGILYYGKTGNLFVRLRDCIGRFEGKTSYPHSGAKTYCDYFSKTGWFENGLIQVRWKICRNEKEARAEEKKLIESYRKKFMDSPPLNSVS